MKKVLLRQLAVALDGLEVGLCVFDRADRAQGWNDTFLAFFPEHRGHVHLGEPYADNLRRFYEARLTGDERALIDRYIAEGLTRHHAQRRPYEFDHRGERLRVSSVELGRFGRLRVWRRVGPARAAAAVPAAPFGELAWARILERIPDGVLVVDPGDRVLWANRAFVQLYGLDGTALQGTDFEALYRRAWRDEPQSPGFLASLEALREHRRFAGAPYELALPGDRWVRVVEQAADADGGTGCFVHADITAARRQQRALQAAEERARESESRYRLLAEYSSDVTAAVRDGVVTYISPAVTAVLGWRPEQVLGRRWDSFCHPDDAAGLLARLPRAWARPEADYRARVLHADGSHVWVESRARRARPPRGQRREAPVIINIRGIGERKQVEDQLAAAARRLEALAVTDALTGVANRRRFDDALDAECRRALRDGSELSLLLCDLDDFKRVNDALGHPVGDAVLRRIGALLSAHAQRAGDLAARYGGEEFALLLPHTPAAQARALGEALRQAVEAVTDWPAGVGRLTLSLGLASSAHAGVAGSPRRLVLHADHALYAAKRQGRNRLVVARGGGPEADRPGERGQAPGAVSRA